MSTLTIKVWDPLVRIFHWSLVAGFFVAYLTEDDFMTLHVWAGYLVGGLVAFRIVWGFIGSKHARFSDFVRPPGEVIAYLKAELAGRARRYLGHNPAGGAMVVALLLSLVLTVVTGLIIYGGDECAGPLASYLCGTGEAFDELGEEVHEFFANLTLLLVVLHVVGVVLSSRLHGENLVHAMLTGRKPANTGETKGDDV
ncbi:cytochrome b/b6 domain-containing protein [endosymbiont of unidentified scaly snail isolate Monju]|uniref:cytochrome b/b6 domain-containing protein n=1 Tax=endosymbiont of unidentified scaly snail isolate Monju TaxID=1248727 RepID=UPI000389265E|nr:cytochrome b/b6 domain-containing protein [endosymbiont of unidentified scaly snail isolate Monju]BAN69279.1 cytochrome b561 [endosymbiont of unidentified scaly snail isolate Monju]